MRVEADSQFEKDGVEEEINVERKWLLRERRERLEEGYKIDVIREDGYQMRSTIARAVRLHDLTLICLLKGFTDI